MTTYRKSRNHAKKTSTVNMEGWLGGLPVNAYMDHQAKYCDNLRESDKLIIAEILRFLKEHLDLPVTCGT